MWGRRSRGGRGAFGGGGKRGGRGLLLQPGTGSRRPSGRDARRDVAIGTTAPIVVGGGSRRTTQERLRERRAVRAIRAKSTIDVRARLAFLSRSERASLIRN